MLCSGKNTQEGIFVIDGMQVSMDMCMEQLHLLLQLRYMALSGNSLLELAIILTYQWIWANLQVVQLTRSSKCRFFDQ